jgi:hypothetical protein
MRRYQMVAASPIAHWAFGWTVLAVLCAVSAMLTAA